MSISGFTKKRIDLTITLGAGAYGETVGDTVTLTRHRMMADIALAGGETMGALQVRVFGLKQEMMNRLTTIGPTALELLGKNKVLMAAGDDENGMKVAYQGSIITAWADYSAAPDVVFNLLAQTAGVQALKPVGALSYQGSADVAQIMSDLAKSMGFSFENQGVNVKLSNPYFPGTAWAQMRACARAANISATVDNDKLVISPKKGAIVGTVPLISPETGLVGYPSFTSHGLSLKTLYNTDIRLTGLVDVKSSVVNGRYKVWGVSHSLSSELPGGPWFTTVEGFPYVG